MKSSPVKRPVFIQLWKIRFPMAAVLSIGHRISGLLLFLSLPLWWYVFDLALSSEQGFSDAEQIIRSPVMTLALAVLVWSLLHHFLAGIRYLLLDIHIGVDRQPARISAWVVSLLAIVTTLVVLWGWVL